MWLSSPVTGLRLQGSLPRRGLSVSRSPESVEGDRGTDGVWDLTRGPRPGRTRAQRSWVGYRSVSPVETSVDFLVYLT